MSGATDNFLHLMKQAAQQQQNEYAPFVFGHIASYDPKVHRVRLLLPAVRDEDGNAVLTPWMPLGSQWAGAGFGIQVAPKGGATLKNPTAGEQCLIARIDRSQGFGAVLLMGFNQVNAPPFPDLAPGELGAKHESGSTLKFTKDGDVAVVASRDFTVMATRDVVLGAQRDITLNAAGKVSATSPSEIDMTAPLVKVDGTLEVTQDLRLGGALEGLDGSTYAGDLKVQGEVYRGFGTGAQVSLGGHQHKQTPDSRGDIEADTMAPTAGT